MLWKTYNPLSFVGRGTPSSFQHTRFNGVPPQFLVPFVSTRPSSVPFHFTWLGLISTNERRLRGKRRGSGWNVMRWERKGIGFSVLQPLRDKEEGGPCLMTPRGSDGTDFLHQPRNRTGWVTTIRETQVRWDREAVNPPRSYDWNGQVVTFLLRPPDQVLPLRYSLEISGERASWVRQTVIKAVRSWSFRSNRFTPSRLRAAPFGSRSLR